MSYPSRARWRASVWVLVSGLVCAPALGAGTFTPITAESGLKKIRDAKPTDWWMSGLTFVDLDHDGDLDLFLSDHHDEGLAALNDGTGVFTLASGTYPTSEVHNCLDIDEDGKVDMAMTYADGGAKWWLNKTATGSPLLMLNDVGLGDTRGGNESREEALVDLNKDGKLDWVRSCQGDNFKVDFGDGKGNFKADSVLIPGPLGGALDAGVMFADLDADGDEDFIVNWGGYGVPDDYGHLKVLLNDGQGNLSEKTAEIGLKPEHLAILGAGDVDHDGDVDLIGFEDRKFPEVIYVNDGKGSFTKLEGAVTGSTGSAQYSLWGLAAVTDLDNDGLADILIDGRVFFHVLHGTGGGHFEYANDLWGKITHTAEASVDGGFAFGDIDSDGDLDLLGFTAGDPNRQVELYRNDLPAKHWINVRPVGLAGNKPGVSSQIRIFEAGTDKLLWYEEVLAFSKQAQQNYYAFDQLERHYGLGDRTSVDITIQFYPSGTTLRKDGAMADTTVTIGEDGTNGVVEPPQPKPVDPAGGAAAGSTATGGTAMGGSATSSNAMGGNATDGSATSGNAGTEPASKAGSGDESGCSCRVGAPAPSRGPASLLAAGILGLAGWSARHARRPRKLR